MHANVENKIFCNYKNCGLSSSLRQFSSNSIQFIMQNKFIQHQDPTYPSSTKHAALLHDWIKKRSWSSGKKNKQQKKEEEKKCSKVFGSLAHYKTSLQAHPNPNTKRKDLKQRKRRNQTGSWTQNSKSDLDNNANLWKTKVSATKQLQYLPFLSCNQFNMKLENDTYPSSAKKWLHGKIWNREKELTIRNTTQK